MNTETKQRALLAAAKVALVTTVGCSASHAPASVADAEPGNDAALARDMSVLADAAIFEDSAVDTSDASESEVAACVSSLSATVAGLVGSDGNIQRPVADEVVAESRPCCEVVQADIDGAGSWDWPAADAGDLRSFCCGDVFQWGSGGSCTPWGPPMPPAMPTHLAGAFA